MNGSASSPGRRAEVDLGRFDAVIFDMDGVVTDTALTHARAWKEVFDEFLRDLSAASGEILAPFDIETDYLKYVDGKPRFAGAKSFLESRGIDLPDGTPDDDPTQKTVWGVSMRKQQLFLAWLMASGARAYQTSLQFIERLRSAGVKTAIITASRNCSEVLEAAGVEDVFDTQVDGNCATALGLAGKPAPDIFMEAARRLRIEPARTVVIEDAQAGVAAGRNGGFGLVIGVDRAGQAAELERAGAHVVVNDLADIHVVGRGAVGGRLRAVRMRDLPRATESMDEIATAVGERTPVFFLDYDGTLTPIVERPEDALLDEGMREIIRELADTATVAIVSGRDVEFVTEQVRVDGVVYAGSHGFDIVGPVTLATEALAEFDAFAPLIDTAEARLRETLAAVRGARVERKRYSVAVHYRQVDIDDIGLVTAAVDAVIAIEPKLRKGLGKKVYEIRPDVDWGKGRAVLWLFDALGFDSATAIPFYVGDDITDEDAFAALRELGLGIAVGSADRPSQARYRLEDPDEVGDFLRQATAMARKESS